MASYKIICYFSDTNIFYTSIYMSNTGNTYYGYYNNPFSIELDTAGLSIFEATPQPESNFSRWVYRLGSPTATQQFSYDSTFMYEGAGGDIYIRAESSSQVVPQTVNVTVYANDPNIPYIYIQNGYGNLISVPYDGSVTGNIYSVEVGATLTFSAQVAFGYTFKQWVYRIGSTTSYQQTSTLQTINIQCTSNIYIRAEATRLKSFTLSFPNAGIQYTQCDITSIGLSYGGSYNNNDISYGGFDGSTSFRFYATVASGAQFDHWTYTLGNSTQKYTTTLNPFVYSGSDDIHIYAMSSQEWYLCQSINAQSLQNTRYSNITFSQYGYCLARFSFASTGTATFITTGGLDTIGYIGTSSNVDSELGTLRYYSVSADEGASGNNFSFTVNVTAGQTYYILIRCKHQLSSGDATLVVYPPGVSPSGTGIFVYDGTVWREVQPYVFNGSTWQKAGAQIYTGTTWQQCSS